LSEHPWILAGSRSHLGKAVLLACRQQGFDPQIMHTVEEQSTALAMVAGGLGVSLVSDLALDSVPEGVSIVALDQPVMRTVSIARRRAAGPRSALDLVIDAVRTAAAEKGIAADTEPPLEAGSVEDR
ncbi:MAG: LysR substrate-binding domain-containing protein, partial [Yaniella sp.]|nr:LysR substrate-binding domain-containing protein [Yaniella sp.]